MAGPARAKPWADGWKSGGGSPQSRTLARIWATPGNAKHPDNSPAFQGWVERRAWGKSPAGTTENVVAVRKDLSSLTGLENVAEENPPPETADYFPGGIRSDNSEGIGSDSPVLGRPLVLRACFSLSGRHLVGSRNRTVQTLRPELMRVILVEHLPGPIPPLLIRRTAQDFLQALRSDLNDRQPVLECGEFGDGFGLDGFQCRTESSPRAF